MSRRAEVYRNDILAGILSEENGSIYKFEYDLEYFHNENYPAVSLTMPKTKKVYLKMEV